ncbi:MAG: DUF4252 domain-containing protein [Saprospiraceae bacterium]
MKIYLPCTFVLLMIAAVDLPAQKSVNTIVDQLKKTENYEGISIPGWIIRLGIRIAATDDNDIEQNGLLHISKGIKHLRVATTTLDVNKYDPAAIVSNFMQKMRDKDGFEEYVSVRSEDQHLKIMVQEDDDEIKNMVIVNAEGGEIAMIHLKTKLKYEDLRQVSFRQITHDSGKISNYHDSSATLNQYK